MRIIQEPGVQVGPVSCEFPVASWLGSLNRIPKVKGSITVQELKYLPSSSQRVNLTFFLRYVVCDDKYCYSKYSVSSFDRLWEAYTSVYLPHLPDGILVTNFQGLKISYENPIGQLR